MSVDLYDSFESYESTELESDKSELVKLEEFLIFFFVSLPAEDIDSSESEITLPSSAGPGGPPRLEMHAVQPEHISGVNNGLGLGIHHDKAIFGMICCIACKQTGLFPCQHLGGCRCMGLDHSSHPCDL